MPVHPRWWRVLLQAAPALVIATAFGWQSRPAASNAQPDARIGFSTRALVEERKAESAFAAQLSTESISRFHRDITRRPHTAGSPASMEVAEKIRKGLKDAGFETEVEEFQVYLSTPRSISAALLEPVQEPLNVREPANPLDPDSSNPELAPAFVAYSASGDVRATVVYVNYGLPPDYAKVEAAGVDVRGKIVLARYAKSHRAVKIHWPDATTPRLNDHLTHLEQDLLDESERPAKRWYRHVIYGWNIYSLYDGQPLPGLAEAIRLKDKARVATETVRIEKALQRMLGELKGIE